MTETREQAWITELDRLDAVENVAASMVALARELVIIDALNQHQICYENTKNLGYYRKFLECTCGQGWWFGGHVGDPSADDRWDIHRAEVIAALPVSGNEGKVTP